MGLHKVFVVFFVVGSVAARLSGPEFETTTSITPSLRFIDSINTDGSYTHGFESEDGTYKVETKLPSGEVTGKYGYIDSTGILRETSYGEEENRIEDDVKAKNEKRGSLSYTRYTHFKPRRIGGGLMNNVDKIKKQIKQIKIETQKSIQVEKKENKITKLKSRFEHFKDRKEQEEIANNMKNMKNKNSKVSVNTPIDKKVTETTKMVNGRRVKKKLRLKTKPRQGTPSSSKKPQRGTKLSSLKPPKGDLQSTNKVEQPTREQHQEERKLMLMALEKEKQNLLQMHQSRHNLIPITKNKERPGINQLTILPHPEQQIEDRNQVGTDILLGPKLSSEEIPLVPKLNSEDSPLVPKLSSDQIWKDHPFITGFDLTRGSYSVKYGSV